MITYLVAHLEAHAGLNGLVGTRIYPLLLPQKATLPAIAYMQISRTPVHVRNSAIDLLVNTRWQFDVNARTYAAAQQVTAQLKNGLQTFSRSSSPRVDVVFVENERDDTEPSFDENNYYRIMVDALIWHEEA